ncbi:hypothetical protein [Azospirillum halopraeferens]|uniref:hypothetical protein n=1 Tax=Azospirillum halopraeferens TaxID=34010 RepID=UPI00041019C8|nr:hypothetical protein [Azospirillum halopraeferens]
MISCTSGMIHWTWEWLTQKKRVEAGTAARVDLGALVQQAVDATPYRGALLPLNYWLVAMHGLEGVLEPAWADYMRRLVALPPPATPQALLDRLLPAQTFVPARPPAHFAAIADCFNEASIPILFNSYDPAAGIEYVHANPAGRAMLDARRKARSELTADRTTEEKARLHDSLPRTEEADITPQAVRDALWLTSYGFDAPDPASAEGRRIDGAYVRQFMLSELCDADTIYMARPQAYGFRGRLPQNQFEVKDLETELWFNGPYAQQVAAIDFVNRLVRHGKLGEPFREVTLVPVEIPVQRGFFSYFFEDMTVFDTARALSDKAFAAESCRRAGTPPVRIVLD